MPLIDPQRSTRSTGPNQNQPSDDTIPNLTSQNQTQIGLGPNSHRDYTSASTRMLKAMLRLAPNRFLRLRTQQTPGLKPASILLAPLSMALLLAQTAPVYAQSHIQSQLQIRPLQVAVNLVTLDVDVTAQNGQPVTGLTQENFSILENGIRQKIAVFEPHTDRPLSIVLALDTSGSVAKDHKTEIRAARAFARTLLRPTDRMEVLAFNTNVQVAVPFTHRLRTIDHGLDHLPRGPATAFYRALVKGAEDLSAQPGRRVLVVISDGGNTVSGTSYQQAEQALLVAHAKVESIIDLPMLNSAGIDLGGAHAMIALAEATGGEYFYEQNGGLDSIFAQLATSLRQQYLLAYYPQQANPPYPVFHTLTVQLEGPHTAGLTAHYRSGYYTGSNAPTEENQSPDNPPADGGP